MYIYLLQRWEFSPLNINILAKMSDNTPTTVIKNIPKNVRVPSGNSGDTFNQ
jgi:hypothetical protein